MGVRKMFVALCFQLGRKMFVALAFLLGFGFLAAYSASIYIHRNDGRFRVVGELPGGSTIDSRTGQMCITIGPGTPPDLPPCRDLR